MSQLIASNTTDISTNGASNTDTSYSEGSTPLSELLGAGVGSAGNGWGELNKNLICSIYEVDHKGNLFNGTAIVRATFVNDVTLDITGNWQSPFEGAGAESKAPALMAMLQSGALQPLIDQSETAKNLMQDTVNEARGRTGITQLNSTQVFNGMPPMKLQGTIYLRAWLDPIAEVENVLDTLVQWSLPVFLAEAGTLLSNSIEFAQGKSDKSLIETIMPSEAPPFVGITYKGRTYAPMVIENISVPLHSPVDKNGNFVTLAIPITFSSLTALDGQTWLKNKMRSY